MAEWFGKIIYRIIFERINRSHKADEVYRLPSHQRRRPADLKAINMSRGYDHHKKPWSKLQKELYNLILRDINLQIHCTVYSFSTKFDTFESPRYWITLAKEIIWDFPSQFLKWKHPDVPKPLKYLDETFFHNHGSIVSNLFRQYIDTPRDELMSKRFEEDYWELINILRAADRRIGKRRLMTFRQGIPSGCAAEKVLKRRLAE